MKGKNVANQPTKGRKAPTKPKKNTKKAADTPESGVAQPAVVDAIPAEVHRAQDPAPAQPVPTTASDPEPTSPPADAPQAEAVSATRPSILPFALGGVVAGLIGFVGATLLSPAPDTTLADQLAVQAAKISALEQRVAAVPAVDLTGIEGAQARLADQLSELVDRVTALEDRPTATVASGAAGEAVSSEIDALRAQIAEMANAAQTELEQARAEAAAIEENAAEAARNAAARAALARVQTALESGAPIGAALGDLEQALGQSAPDALITAQDGVPTLAQLQVEFPDAARAALATARSEGVAGEEASGVAAFLRNQFDVRSTTPQEGDSVDAILSRAEATMRAGRLSDTLAEISALPEVARAEMSEWLARAEMRADAVAAVDILSTTLSGN